jgi:mannose-1-phosphate guanylyltransferase/mannose-6-phosphate isomerase
MNPLLIPVLMCGGAGTGLWPVSRECMAKQLVPLLEQSSTFCEMLQLISVADLFARPIVFTHEDFRFVVANNPRRDAQRGGRARG